MGSITFSDRGFDDYRYWQTHDAKTLAKLNRLLMDASRHPFTGEGKPERLAHGKHGEWSRRINEKDRLVYTASGGNVSVIQCRGHYDDK